VPATILCVDDDRHFCKILSRALEREGYRVETAHDGDSALEKIVSLRPELMTLDVMLPRRDGFQVLESVRGGTAGLSETPVLLMSGCTFTPDSQERARELAADAVLTKPVRLDALLQMVSERLAAGATRKPRAQAGTSGMSGRIEEIPVPALFHHLHGMRGTGVLEVRSGKKKKQIQFREGVPIAVRSNLVNETLGHLLVASGTITWDALHESLQRVKRGEGLQGQILQAMHMLDEEDLAKALRRQAMEKLFQVFGWYEGRFRFHPRTRLKAANSLSLKVSPARIVMEGVRTRFPITSIDAFLSERSAWIPVVGESPFYRFQEVELDEGSQRLLDQLDGRSLAGLGDLSEPARRALYALVVLEMVELRDPDRVEARAATRPPEKQRAPRRIREVQHHVEPAEARSGRAEHDIRGQLTELAQRFAGLDAFGVLDVSRSASDDDVRNAYAELAKRTHPDHRLQYIARERGRAQEEKELAEGHRALQGEIAFQKGEAALRAKRIERALEHFERAVALYPEEGEYHAYRGWTHYLAAPERPQRLAEAIGFVQKGRKLAPDREKPYLFLGRLCLADGRQDIAEKMFARAVQLDPDCVEALRELRLLHMRREKSKGIVRRILRR
jgi:CheY-like chemotaxis protein/tetratricopeptide (TPR) repeat protein